MKYGAMALVFFIVVLTIGLLSTFGVDEVNPSPEQWIAAAQDIEGDGTDIEDMSPKEIEISSTAMQVEAFQILNSRAGIGMWAIGIIAGAVLVRVLFVDLLGLGRKPKNS